MDGFYIFIIILFILIIITIIVIFVVFYYNRKNNPTFEPIVPVDPITSTYVKYGDIIKLFNINSQYGGYATTCTEYSGDGKNIYMNKNIESSDNWIISSVDSNITTGTLIKYGDKLKFVKVNTTEELNIISFTDSSVCMDVGTVVVINPINITQPSYSNFTITNSAAQPEDIVKYTDQSIRLSNFESFSVLSICGTISCGFSMMTDLISNGGGRFPDWKLIYIR